jgi:formylmethanofuran dehydrogenase subunit B
MGIRGSIFRTLKELEFVAMGLSSSRRRKNEERLKQFIENLSETSRQKLEKSCSG